MKSYLTSNVKLLVANYVSFAGGQLQKKGLSLDIVKQKSLKYVKDVFCVDHLSFVQNVTNVPVVAPDLPVGARLHQFWEACVAVVASPKVIRILKESYTLLFWIQLNPMSLTIISACVVPLRNSCLTVHAKKQ